MLTVGQLRNRIEGLPDDSPVLINYGNAGPDVHLTNYGTTKHPRWALEWPRYQTMEAGNGYQANDDRYDQNQILLIEIGDLSP